jgi:hypothetical protein
MGSRRSTYDWVREETNRDHWLCVENRYGDTLESTKLPAGTDLIRALIGALHRWSDDGWNIETFGSNSSSFFCNRSGKRRFVHIRPTEPGKLSKVDSDV